MKDFSGFLDMRRYKNWAHKINCRKYLCEDTEWQWIVLQKHCLLVLQPLKAQRDSFLISTLKSSQGDWRSAAAAARFNPCRWQVPIYSWQGPLYCNLWGISWPFCPAVLGRLISRSGKDFTNSCAVTELGLIKSNQRTQDCFTNLL